MAASAIAVGLYREILDAAVQSVGSDARSVQAVDEEQKGLVLVAHCGMHPASAAGLPELDSLLLRKRTTRSLCPDCETQRHLLVEIPAPDVMTALDLEVRLQETTLPAEVVAGAEPKVFVPCPPVALRVVLKCLAERLEGFSVREVETRVDHQPYTPHHSAEGGLRSHEVEAGELGDVELDP